MAQGQPVTYTVKAVTPDSQFTGLNTPVAGKRVTFSTSTGYEGSVFVPDSVFSDRNAVQAMIAEEVRRVAAIQSLTGQLPG